MKRSEAESWVDHSRSAEGSRLGELYLRHAHGALQLAYLLTGDRQAAQDVVQEAFVRVAGRMRHLRNPNAFPAYLRSTVVNIIRGQWRRARIEAKHTESLVSQSYSDPDVALREDLRRGLRKLPYRQRAAVVLRFYEQMTDDEISRLLRCRRATVRSLVARGLAALRETVKGEVDE